MLKLKRLKIHKLPRVKPGTELVFNDGINVLLGINGSGKTTLLKLLCDLLSGDLHRLRDSEFHLEYELHNREWPCTFSVQHRPVTRGDISGEDTTRSEAHLHAPDGPVTVLLEGNKVSVTSRGMATKSRPLGGLAPLNIGNTAAFLPAKSPPMLTRTERLDESTYWLESVTDSASLEAIEPYAWDPVPRSPFENFILQLLRNTAERDVHQIDAGQLPFLQATASVLGCTTASLQFDLQHQQRRDQDDFFLYTFGDFRFRFVKADGTRLTHHELSFGQQRLLAFHFYAAMHPEVIVADELTNGMHHAMIGQCIDLIGERQAFLATQNPLLLDNLPGFTSAEQVQSTFILCTTERENDRERMVWRNMTAEEAGNFFRDYQVGISHTNDILRSWGLW